MKKKKPYFSMRTKTVYRIKSVHKALKVLMAFGPDRPERGLTELAEEVGLPKSVAFKLVRTLMEEGFLEQVTPGREYRIGPAVLRVARAFLNSSALLREGQTALREVATATGHTATLGIRDHREVLFVAVAEGTHFVRATAGIGDRRPLHATATGKVILADLSADEIMGLLGRGSLPTYTRRTIGRVARLLEELGTVRREGIAFNLQERTEEASAVAVPVRDVTGRVVAGLAVTFPAHREDSAFLSAVAEVLRTHGERLSARLGAPTWMGGPKRASPPRKTPKKPPAFTRIPTASTRSPVGGRS